MKKIINPFNDRGINQCFGCSAVNAIGLKMNFFEDEGYTCCRWSPRHDLQGYVNVLHGGIQATLLDELASWTVYTQAGTGGVTSSMEIRYIKPVYVNKGDLLLKARLTGQKRNTASIRAELFNKEGQLCTEADIVYFIVPESIARKRYFYPGVDAFFEK